MATADDMDAESEEQAAAASVRAVVGPLDAEADVVKAVSAAQRLAALKRLRAAAVVARVPAVANAVVSQISLLQRGAHRHDQERPRGQCLAAAAR